MKTFYRYAALVAGSLLGLCACSSDDDVADTSGKTPVAQPQVIVSELTTTGFKIRWEAVEGAGAYVYTFNGSEETSTDACQLSFGDLERQKEYVVAVKATPKFADENTESPYTYVHVVTDDLEQLPRPKITLGCAYASKTLITWTEVPETALYEYTIGGETYTTTDRMVTLGNLSKDRDYTFSLRAMTGDATRFTNSEPAELPFRTSADDIPAILIAPTLVISDAVEFNVYASSDETYFYDVIPATLFVKNTPEEIIAAYQEYALEYAQQQGISIQLAMASLLKSGTQTIQVKGLTPELSYVAFAFGMNLKGQITRGLSSVQFKTTSDGYSDGPNYGGSDWFKQSFYITNAYAGLTGYGWTNSVWTLWQGQDVTSVRYRTLTTKLFSQVFPDANDKQSITAFLKDDDYSYPVEESLLTMVNSTTGYNMVSAANMGTSYTLLSLATSSGGDETLCVNSVTTKTSTSSATWFMARPVKDEHYGPTHNTIAGVMQGVSVSSARYAIFPQTAIAEIAESKYPQLIEEYGSDIKDEFIPYINGNGFAIVFEQSNGIKPSTTYVFMVTAKNSVGDALTKYGSVTTDAAPDASTQAATRSAAPLRSLVGRPIDNPGKFIFPMESFTLPADARPEGDLWTIIHNTHNIK